MWVMYFSMMIMSLSLLNVYIIWLFMELMFIIFLLVVLNYEAKSVGLVIYFFFQSLMSLFLFFIIFFSLSKLFFMLLCAKLGLFPFFYWVIIVSMKVGYLANLFILVFQKIIIFWLLWLWQEINMSIFFFMVYLSVFFVVLCLLSVSDLWLILVYSSIANTSMLMLSSVGNYYFIMIFIYLSIIVGIIFLMWKMSSYFEIVFIVFMFLVIPPFVLFFMKLYLVMSMDFFLKLIFFLMIFDVLVLLYYFSLIFMKLLLLENSVSLYYMNLFLMSMILLFSNCVTLIIFY